MLSVGKVIYLLDKKTHAIIPCMVIEKVSSVSLEGETVHHIITSPTGKKIKLENYKSPWFPSIEEARTFLVDTSMKLIDRVINDALEIADNSFKTAQVASPNLDEPLSDVYEEDNTIESDVESFANNVLVDLGNGQTAKVTLSSGGE